MDAALYSRVKALEAEKDVLVTVVAGLLDCLKWHLRSADGTDQRALDGALHAFERKFIKEPDQQ